MVPGQCSQYGDTTSGWTIQDSNPGRDQRFFSSPSLPDRPWSSLTCPLLSGCWCYFPRVKWLGHYDLHPSLRVSEALSPLPPHRPSWCQQGRIYLSSQELYEACVFIFDWPSWRIVLYTFDMNNHVWGTLIRACGWCEGSFSHSVQSMRVH